MGRIHTLGVVAVFAALGACSHLPLGLEPVEASAPAVMPGQVEPIHAAAITRDQAVFWVSSNGCTSKQDVTPMVRRVGGEVVITLRRLEEDRCDKPLRDGVQLQWSFDELGLRPGSSVTVQNPYQLPPQG